MELWVYVQSPVLYITMELLFLPCHVLFDCLEADLQEGLQLALQWSHLPARLECDSSDATSAALPDSSIHFHQIHRFRKLVGERNFVVRNLSSCEDITFSFTDILFVISICELSDWCKV
jgi:hypothetical protein